MLSLTPEHFIIYLNCVICFIPSAIVIAGSGFSPLRTLIYTVYMKST